MEIRSYEDVEVSEGFGLSKALDRIVQRGVELSDGFERMMDDDDLLLCMCATSKGAGLTTIGGKEVGWTCDASKINERINSFPGAAVLLISDIDLTIIVEDSQVTDRKELMGNQEYEMTKTDFLAEIRRRL